MEKLSEQIDDEFAEVNKLSENKLTLPRYKKIMEETIDSLKKVSYAILKNRPVANKLEQKCKFFVTTVEKIKSHAVKKSEGFVLISKKLGRAGKNIDGDLIKDLIAGNWSNYFGLCCAPKDYYKNLNAEYVKTLFNTCKMDMEITIYLLFNEEKSMEAFLCSELVRWLNDNFNLGATVL